MSDNIAENRLFILDVFRRMQTAMTNDQAIWLLVDSGIFTYFEAQIELMDMAQCGLLQFIEDRKAQYSITPAGLSMLNELKGHIRPSWREISEELTSENLPRIQLENTLLSNYEQTPQGDYIVELNVMEDDRAQMTLRFVQPDRRTAAQLAGAWRKRGADIYKSILFTLGEPFDDPFYP